MMSAATLTLIPGSAMAKRPSSQSVRRPKASATASAMASMELLFRRIGDAAQLKLLFDSFLPGRLPNLESFTLFGNPRVLRQHSRKLG